MSGYVGSLLKKLYLDVLTLIRLLKSSLSKCVCMCSPVENVLPDAFECVRPVKHFVLMYLHVFPIKICLEGCVH